MKRKNGGIYQRLVIKALRGMKRGRLEMRLPQGRTEVIGEAVETTASIQIVNSAFFKKCALYGDIGFGESFVDGDWETDDITAVIRWFLLNVEDAPTMSGSRKIFSSSNMLKIANRIFHVIRDNSPRMAKRNIAEHYDLSNEFFQTFLDETMTYSAAYFRDENMSLREAQIEKYDRLCRQLKITSSDHVLEIGSGWGGFACYAAKTYGCKITTLTISEEQFQFAQKRIREENLSDRIEIRLADYRTIKGQFDKIVSIEMMEAVGHRYLSTYFKKIHEVLKKDGAFGFQVIICPDTRYDELRRGVDWIQKHIFPGSLLPSIHAIQQAMRKSTDLTLMDAKNLGLDYAKTLTLWRDRFNEKSEEILKLGFDDKFRKKWNYYFCYCEAAFAMRNINVVQMVYARPNNLSL